MSTGRNPAAERIARLRQNVVNLPGIGFGSPLVLALGAADAAAQALNLNLKQVGALGGVAAGALGLVVVQLIAFNKGLNESKDRLGAALNAQERYFDAVATLTEEQARQQIGALQRTNAVLQQQINETRNAAERAFAAAQRGFTGSDTAISPAGDLAARIGTALTGDQLNTQLAELQKQFAANQDTATRLTQGLEEGAFAANTAAQAEFDLANARREAFEFSQDLERLRTNNQVRDAQIVLSADRLTAEEREARIALIERERAILEQQNGQLRLTIDAHSQLSEQYNALGRELEFLKNIAGTYADELERETKLKEALTTQTDEYFKALDLEADAREKLIEISRQLAELEEETALRRQQAADDRGERISDIETDAAERREKIISDGLDRINKIQRDAGRKQLSAIGLRDALALYEAKLHAQDQLQDQKEAQEKQLRSVNDAMEKQRRNIERSYERQLETINRSYDRQQQRLNYAYQVQEVALQNAIAAQQAIALNGSGGQRIIHTQMWTDLNAIAVQWAFNTINTLRSIFGLNGGGGGVLPGNTIPPGGVPGFLGSTAFNNAVDRRLNFNLRGSL